MPVGQVPLVLLTRLFLSCLNPVNHKSQLKICLLHKAHRTYWLYCAVSAMHLSSVPGLGRSPGEGNGNPLQCSCPENSMDRGAWQATIHGVAESGMIGRLTLTYSPYHVSLDNKSFVPPFSLCVISRYNCNSWEGPHTILRGRYLPTKRPYYSPCLKYP